MEKIIYNGTDEFFEVNNFFEYMNTKPCVDKMDTFGAAQIFGAIGVYKSIWMYNPYGVAVYHTANENKRAYGTSKGQLATVTLFGNPEEIGKVEKIILKAAQDFKRAQSETLVDETIADEESRSV